ncbi:hypothetical protein BS50DRAFT_573414 [Corynespora cassiicola Philippines]|uniref:Uncharacterized protein n=1 Tax=Corynespora cassiicola Philippines TaxID=1448308 RepID=A0A2T2NT03_CORCC|nr:hypothetical protein BS50DRAFT_573414 [Corynespora cassiicola Philippines]
MRYDVSGNKSENFPSLFFLGELTCTPQTPSSTGSKCPAWRIFSYGTSQPANKDLHKHKRIRTAAQPELGASDHCSNHRELENGRTDCRYKRGTSGCSSPVSFCPTTAALKSRSRNFPASEVCCVGALSRDLRGTEKSFASESYPSPRGPRFSMQGM